MPNTLLLKMSVPQHRLRQDHRDPGCQKAKMSRALRAMSCLASYNTTVIVITAVVSALLSLIGVMCILLATVPSRESLPSLISTVVLLSALSFGLVKTAAGLKRKLHSYSLSYHDRGLEYR